MTSGSNRPTLRTLLAPRHRPYDEEGLSIIEVVLAFIVMLIVLVPIAYLLENVVGQAAGAVQKTAALNVAEQWVETLNNQGPPTTNGIPQVGTPIAYGSQTEGNIIYTVSAEFNWTANGNPNLCTANVLPQVIDLTVTVTWDNQKNAVTDTTILAYPPSGVPTYGFLGVQIYGDPSASPPDDRQGIHWGEQYNVAGRVMSVPVVATNTVTGQVYPTVNPDTLGCAFMEVPPGTYTVTIGPDSTYRTPFVAPGSFSGTVTIANQVVVVNAVTAPPPTQYDEGAFAQLSYPNTTTTEDGLSCPNVGSLQCIAAGQSPMGSAVDGSTGMLATVSVLSGTSWATETLPPSITRVLSTSCSALCVAVGYGPGGAAVATAAPTSPNTWTAGGIANVSMLTQVTCPNATMCLALGTSSTGPVLLSGTIAGNSLTWATDSLPAGVTSLTQIECPAGSAACLAIGAGASGAVIVAGSQAPAAQAFVTDALPAGLPVSQLSQLTCSGTTACIAIGSGSGPVVLGGLPQAATQTWVQDPLPGGVVSLSQVVCSGTACTAIGQGVGAPVIAAGALSAGAGSWVLDAVPGGITGLSQLTCSGATACMAVGTDGAGPVVVAGDVQSTAQTWVNDPLPAGILGLTSITCTSTCVAAGYGASTAALLVANVSSATQTFAGSTFGVGVLSSPASLAGLACYGAPLTCVAAGASQSSGVLLVNADTTSSSAPADWTDSAVAGVSGLYTAGMPVSVANPSSVLFVTCGPGSKPAVACGSSIGPLYPYQAGYQIGAGDCSAELLYHAQSLSSVPGTSLSGAPAPSLALGLLPVQVLSANGAPQPGASVTVKVADPIQPSNAACLDNVAYSMPTTDSQGLSRLDVIYETYTLTASANGSTATATVTVNPTGVSVNGGPIVPGPGVITVAL